MYPWRLKRWIRRAHVCLSPRTDASFAGVCVKCARANMRPILLKGHERPLTFIKYNREGDLLFTCAKDHHPTLWYSDDGERVGTYIGHNGAVWTCDITGTCDDRDRVDAS